MGKRAGTPAERLLRLGAYLREHPVEPLTLSRISADVPGYPDAERDEHGDLVADGTGWEAVRKQVRRDLDDLDAQLGVVVAWDDDLQAYRLRPPFLTRDERRALLAAAAVVEVEGLGPPPTIGELGAAVDAGTPEVVLRVHRWVVDLADAVRTRTPVTFRHQGRDRTLDPYAVGVWRNRWYVVGRDHAADDRRLFRLDRIEEPDGVDAVRPAGPPGAFDLPDGFDAAEALRLDPNVWGHDPHVVAEVRVGLDRLPAFEHELGGHVVERGLDHAVVEVDVRHYESFRIRLVGFGDDVRLLGPPALVDDLRAWLAAIAEAD